MHRLSSANFRFVLAALLLLLPPAMTMDSMAYNTKKGPQKAPGSGAQTIPAPETHTLAGTWYDIRGLRGTLILNNKGADTIPADITLWNAAGAAFETPPVTIDPSSVKRLDLNELVDEAAPSFLSGRV